MILHGDLYVCSLLSCAPQWPIIATLHELPCRGWSDLSRQNTSVDVLFDPIGEILYRKQRDIHEISESTKTGPKNESDFGRQ
jgi:hypothetical protein